MKQVLLLIFMITLGMLDIHAQELSWDEKLDLQQRIKERLDDFISYLPEIADKKNKPYDEQQLALKYIKKVLGLFIGEGEYYEYFDQAGTKRLHDPVKIQTKKRDKYSKSISIKRYLYRLMVLPYKQINIDTCYAFRMDSLVHNLGNGVFLATGTMVYYCHSGIGDTYAFHEKNCVQLSLYVRRIEYIISPNGEKRYAWSHGELGDLKVTIRK